MIKQFAGTTATRIFTASISFITIILSTRFLGAEQFGNISVFILSIALIHLVAGIAGGPALVYFIPRMPLKLIFSASFIWSALVHLVALLLFSMLPLFYGGFHKYLILISLLAYLNNFSSSALLARQKILSYNILLITQSLLLVLSLAIQFYYIAEPSFQNYIYSLFLSVLVPAIIGWVLIFPEFSKGYTEPFWQGFLRMVKYGGLFQLTNGIQLLNYRLSYYLIDFFTGRAFLGIYAAGVQLSEGIWIFGKSFATVQYTQISNSNDDLFARRITLQLLKITFIITSVFVVVLMALPQNAYSFVFGEDFRMVKYVVIFMATGTLTLNLSQILSHYFSGIGLQKHNAIGSVIGLTVTAVAGLLLIPQYGIQGAAVTASIAYTGSFLWQLLVFGRKNKITLRDLSITGEEWKQIKTLMGKVKGSR